MRQNDYFSQNGYLYLQISLLFDQAYFSACAKL